MNVQSGGGGRLLTTKWRAIAAAATKMGGCPMLPRRRAVNDCTGCPWGVRGGGVSQSPPLQSRLVPVLHERCFQVHLNRCRHKKGNLPCCGTVPVQTTFEV